MRRLCILVVFAFALTICAAAAPAHADQRSAVLAQVHKFVDSFNKGDEKAGEAACASPASIVDEFAPHQWDGPAACAAWAHAYDANAAANGITDGFVTIETPWRVDIAGDRAYVVTPVQYAYKQHGKPVLEPASVFTVVLKRFSTGWLITAWTWSRH